MSGLRTNAAWSAAGQLAASASNWITMILLARLGSPAAVGEYALAIAIAAPVMAFAHLNLRTVLVTDVTGRFAFRDYRDLRLISLCAALAGLGGWALLHPDTGLIAVLAGAMQAAEWMSDVFHGHMQREENMRRIACSILARGMLSACAAAAGLWLGGGIVLALALMTGARLCVLLGSDARVQLPVEPQRRELGALLRETAPLGVTLMLVALLAGLPRYFMDGYLGAEALGLFAVLASFAQTGNLVVNAIGQAATPRLAKLYAAGDSDAFLALSVRIAAAGVAVATGITAGMALLGPWMLRAVFSDRFDASPSVVAALMAAAGVGFIASLLGYAITSARCFTQQVPLLSAAAAATALGSWWLIPALGLYGAALAIAAGYATQLAGEVWILLRAVRPSAEARVAEAAA